MPNKLVVQQVQTIIHALNHLELDRLFLLLQKTSNNQIKKTSKLVGYKCHETLIQYTTIEATGFGRDQVEASVNCIKNFIDVMLEQEDRNGDHYNVLRAALKELKEPGLHDSPTNESNFSSLFNNSFEQNLDGLSKKIGNISMIKDSRLPNLGDNTLCLEGEDLILQEIKQNQQIFESPKKVIKQLNRKFESSAEKLGSLQFQRQSNEEPLKKKSVQKYEQSSNSQQKENLNCQKYCSHEQELKNEKLKIEHLELRMKLILEENRILKSMIADQRCNILQDNSQINNTNNNQKNRLTQSKENVAQPTISERNYSTKSRTTSADDTKRAQMANKQTYGQGISKQIQIQLLALDKVPKLNLDILPNYHAKQPGASINSYLLNMYSNKHKSEQATIF